MTEPGDVGAQQQNAEDDAGKRRRSPEPEPADDAIRAVFREEYGRIVATLISLTRDISRAEEAMQDALERALERWPEDGVPPNPAGWLLTTARRRAIDGWRSDRRRAARERRTQSTSASVADDFADDLDVDDEEGTRMTDDRLRLIFTCCHPALAPAARVALTLQLVGGLTASEIARSFLVSDTAMAQRLVRAKAKIRDARIPYRIPRDAELPDRLPSVLDVVHLIFHEGYVSASADTLTRDDLAVEAVRLARILTDLLPDEAEVRGLLALLVLTHARRAARVDGAGRLVTLSDQDRCRWDTELIAEGHGLVRRCLRQDQPGPYQLRAAIAAVHTDAATTADTAWDQVVALYDQLRVHAPSPIVDLNRGIAVAELHGPAAGLATIEPLALTDNHLWHAAGAELHARLGDLDAARAAFDRAITLATNPVERDHLRRRRALLDSE